jgi:hypothetical protein
MAPASPRGSTRPSRRLTSLAGARTVEVTMSLTFPFDCTNFVAEADPSGGSRPSKSQGPAFARRVLTNSV